MASGGRGDQLEVLATVVGRLDSLRIPYMLSGSLAYSYYVEPRMTRDIDLVIEVDEESATELAETLGDGFYCDVEGAAEAARRRGLFNAIHTRWFVKVDFVVRKEEPYRREEFGRRRLVQVDGIDVWIVTAEDLVLSKLVWARASRSAIQVEDISALLTRGPTLDRPYLDRWAQVLGVTEFLEALGRA